MRKGILLGLVLLTMIDCYGQNKKQQLEQMSRQVDSLQTLLDSERDQALKTIIMLNDQIKVLNIEHKELRDKNARRAERDEREIDYLERKLDSIQKKYGITEIDSKSGQNENLIQLPILPLNKEEILLSAIGTYNLNSIEGSTGVNTMFATYKEGARWKSNSSENRSGERVTQTIKLTNKDVVLLNDLRMEVNADLSIKFYSGRKLIFDVPFIADGMEYKVGEDSLNYFMGYSATTTFDGERLILMADDTVELSEFLKGTFDHVSSDHLLLVYSMEDEAFYLDIFKGVCCDMNTLVFMK
jgi:hypothetical protein